MKYVVERASQWHENQPCEEAKKEPLTYVDKRTTKTLDEARRHPSLGEEWLSEGANHREEGGMVMRDLPKRDCWTVEVEDLHGFIKKYGDIVVSLSSRKEVPLEILIYDDYIE
jgi:hypothetical protein